MYAMPVSRATMMINERITADSRSPTQRGSEVESGLLLGDRGAHAVEAVGDARAEPLGELGHDGPVGASVARGRGATLLALDPTFEVGDRRLALVGVGERQHHVHARVILRGARRRQNDPRRASIQFSPRLVA